jgi:hypothetical protein
MVAHLKHGHMVAEQDNLGWMQFSRFGKALPPASSLHRAQARPRRAYEPVSTEITGPNFSPWPKTASPPAGRV